jgi:hypothetical protein
MRGIRRHLTAGFAALVALLSGVPAHADLLVPAGGSMSLAGGVVDLVCTDVIVGGTLDLGGGRLDNVRSVTIQAGGNIALGTAGTITLAGDWSNGGGSLNPGTGTVFFVDAPTCAATSTISGNSNFYRLSVVSTLGKLYRFAAGSSQNVQHQLTMTGTAASPLRIESTIAGQYANINLVVPVQTMAFLAVRDMSATGEWIALGLTNLINGATIRWFGAPVIPTTSPITLIAMMLTLIALTAHLRRRSARSDTRDTQRTTR